MIKRILFSFVNIRSIVLQIRSVNNSAYNHDNLKRIKNRKRLIWAVLFGGTFVAALFGKKRRKSEAIAQSSLLSKNDHYGTKVSLYNYKGFILPEFVMKNMDVVNKFQCRETDIFVMCFPKTGTTWLQEIVSCIMHGAGINSALSRGLEDRFPYLEFVYPGISSIRKMNDPRLIKTHLPYSLLPLDVLEKKPKIICLIRNPKDVTVSYFHFMRMFTMVNYRGNFENFFEDMVADKVPYGPLWKHYYDAWIHKNEPNVLILFYEDLHKDIHSNVRKIAQFLDKNLTEEEIEEIADHCSFGNMSSNPSVNYKHWDEFGLRNVNEAEFLRKGVIGDWKNYFTDAMNVEMENWIEKNLQDLNLHFMYEAIPKENHM